MPIISSMRVIGRFQVAQMSDGTVQTLTRAGNGIWLPAHGVPAQGPHPIAATGATPGSTAAPVNDYPWPNGDPNSFSPLHYSYVNCTDFVAWRLNRDKGVTKAPWKYTWGQLRPDGGNGDAIGWYQDWKILGWKVDIAPVAGCVAWFGSKVGAEGHVAYVQAVSGSGTVHLEQYNWGTPFTYSSVDVSASETPDSYLQAPP